MTWSGWLCLHLDDRGRPCPRRTMKAAIHERFCEEHREAPAQAPRRAGPTPEYQRAARRRRAAAGLSTQMEAA